MRKFAGAKYEMKTTQYTLVDKINYDRSVWSVSSSVK